MKKATEETGAVALSCFLRWVYAEKLSSKNRKDEKC